MLQRRTGKGNALAGGFARVTGDIVVMFDADGSADAGEITRFVDALKAGADFAKGRRYAEDGGSEDITPVRTLGNRFLNLLFNAAFRTRYTDLCYGYNAFWADLLPLLDLPDHAVPAPADEPMMWGDGFEIETVINCRFAASGVAITRFPRWRSCGSSGSPTSTPCRTACACSGRCSPSGTAPAAPASSSAAWTAPSSPPPPADWSRARHAPASPPDLGTTRHPRTPRANCPPLQRRPSRRDPAVHQTPGERIDTEIDASRPVLFSVHGGRCVDVCPDHVVRFVG